MEGEESVPGCGDAGSSGDVVRDRSRSPHHQRWKMEAEPDDGVPQPLRFNSKPIPGVQPPLNIGNPPPGEIFSHFLMLQFSNSSVKTQSQKPGEREKIKRFIGILLYMSVLDLLKISDFWRLQTIFHVPFTTTVIPRDPFIAILSNLHISDPEKNEENQGTK
ncbi:hypothetical protein L3Q82_021876 [Scortum barcoo]|uniref:Uncharacterized protein n=1 Tax=Scortum barcoo TaxID=214431 RepID=A0ACB8X5Y3_9TELE|nr:hypothetical protein L3Q82_021876 [Scortum barcoo]